MLVACFLLFLLCVSAQHQDLLICRNQCESQNLISCVIGILNDYFSEEKELTYVSMSPDDNDLLKAVHMDLNFNLISRDAAKPMFVPNYGYLIYSSDTESFIEYFENLIKEPVWNPYAQFLIIIKSLDDTNLTQVFDVLLRQHVNNVIVVNGTNDANLYTYNPFDNFACGRYFETVISYGFCLEVRNDLYPDKLVTGLQNCTFRGTLAHHPPFSIEPTKNEYKNKITGMEQYILHTVSESDGFKVDFDFNARGWTFAAVAPNMTAYGPLEILQQNKTDVIFGAMMLLAPQAAAFSPVCGYHDYVDEIRFAVQKAPLVPLWKYFYIEFDLPVWILVIASLVLYFILTVYLLKAKDKGAVLLVLLDNLLLHGRDIQCSMNVKYVLLIWVWFAYIINTFYQSSLVSLTTNPSEEYQVSNEQDIEEFNIRPCIDNNLARYLYTDAEEKQRFNATKINDPACEKVIEAMKLVSYNKNMYTLIPSYFYLYNKHVFNDKWGDPLIYYFDKPYAKFMLCYYFYKGFPVTHRVLINMFHMRENGLAEKNLRDQYFLQSIKFRFSQKELESRFVLPWFIYVIGCLFSAITFIVELMCSYPWRHHCYKSGDI